MLCVLLLLLFATAAAENLPVRFNDMADICYTCQIVASFVSNFIAIATSVGRGRI